MDIKFDNLELWFEGINPNFKNLTNLERLSILFAKNKNTLLIGHKGMSIGGIGLQVSETVELGFYNGILSGYLLYTGNQTNEDIIKEKFLKRLFETSKKFGFNTTKRWDEFAGISIKQINKQ